MPIEDSVDLSDDHLVFVGEYQYSFPAQFIQ